MPNFSYTVGKTWTPYTFDEILKPLVMYTEEYNKQEEALSELATKAGVWENMINPQTDSHAYKMYKQFSNELEDYADQLAKKGLNATSRKRILNMRTRYNKEITPIEQAYVARQKQAEQQQALMKDPTLMLSRRAATTSLDDYIRNPQLDYEVQSGALITKRVADELKNYKNTLLRSGNWRSTASGQLLERRKATGLTREDLVMIMQNPNAFPEIHQLIENVIDTTGIRNWNDQQALDKAYMYAYEALPAGLGEESIDVQKDSSYLNEYEQYKFDKLKAADKEEEGSEGGEGVYFPQVPINSQSSEYNNFDISGLSYNNGNFSTDSIVNIDKKIEDLEKKNELLTRVGNDQNARAALGMAMSNRQVRSNEVLRFANREAALIDEQYKIKEELDNTKDPIKYEILKNRLKELDEDITDIRNYREGIIDDLSLRGGYRSEIRKLKSEKSKIVNQLNNYAKEYSHLSNDPIQAVQLGLALDKQRSLSSTYGSIVQFGEDQKVPEFIIDTALKSASAKEGKSGLYEVDEKGNVGKEISKNEIPNNKDLTLLHTPKGYMLSDKEGKKYLIKSNLAFERLSKEAQLVDFHLNDFSKNAILKAIKIDDGDIYINGRAYNENKLAAITNEYGESIGNGVKVATYVQKNGDIVKAVVVDADSGNPKLIVTSLSDVINGGEGKSSSWNKYQSMRNTGLYTSSVNRKMSSSLQNDENYLIR